MRSASSIFTWAVTITRSSVGRSTTSVRRSPLHFRGRTARTAGTPRTAERLRSAVCFSRKSPVTTPVPHRSFSSKNLLKSRSSRFDWKLPGDTNTSPWHCLCICFQNIGRMFETSNRFFIRPIFLCQNFKIFFLFFHRRSVLEIYRSSGIDDIGQIKPSLAACLACIFLLVYFSLWKGVKSTGKVSFFFQFRCCPATIDLCEFQNFDFQIEKSQIKTLNQTFKRSPSTRVKLWILIRHSRIKIERFKPKGLNFLSSSEAILAFHLKLIN